VAEVQHVRHLTHLRKGAVLQDHQGARWVIHEVERMTPYSTPWVVLTMESPFGGEIRRRVAAGHFLEHDPPRWLLLEPGRPPADGA
jgi:hypothetical protein